MAVLEGVEDASRRLRQRCPVIGSRAAEFGDAASIVTERGARRSFFDPLHRQGRDGVRIDTESTVVISRWPSWDQGPATRVGR